MACHSVCLAWHSVVDTHHRECAHIQICFTTNCRTKQCAGRLLVVLSVALTVAVCACFFAQQAVFDAIGKAVSDEELEELLGDLHAIYCADHYSDGDGERPVELNSTASSWGWDATEDADWESDLAPARDRARAAATPSPCVQCRDVGHVLACGDDLLRGAVDDLLRCDG